MPAISGKQYSLRAYRFLMIAMPYTAGGIFLAFFFLRCFLWYHFR